MKRPQLIPRSLLGAAPCTNRWLSAICIALALLTLPLRAQDPAITMEPADQYSAPGLGASFTARVTATSPAWYEWHFTDGTNDRAFPGTYNNRQGPTLTLTNLQPADFGGYYLVVTNELGTATSRVAQLIHLVDSFERIEMGSTDASWGVAWADYNNDDHPDLLFCNGALVGPMAASLYRNNQDGTFTLVTPEEAGEVASRMANWGCTAWGDYDNDGNLDLIVCDYNVTQSTLWRNLGNGRFTDVTAANSFRADRLGGAPFWGDFNGDGYLDLVVANAWSDSGTRDLLYLNRGEGTFRRVTDGDLPANGGNVEGGSAGDMDGDGDLDILLAHDTGAALFENDGTAGFNRVTSGFPVVSGYCITSSWADYDNDGRLDVFVAVYNQTSQLIHNDGNGHWTMIPLGEPLQTGSGMWADYDNDGDLDLFITRGQGTITSNLLYGNNGDGTFTQVTGSTLVNDQGRWAGCAWADYDNNGFLDLFVTGHNGSPDLLYRNTGNDNHWISLRLVGTVSNRSAIGAKVRVLATLGGKPVWQMREVGGGNRNQNDLRAHFGLGDATVAERVIIEWPSGNVTELTGVAANQLLPVEEKNRFGRQTPARPSASVNGSVTLQAVGSGGLQWQFEGVDLPGETGRNLVLNNLTAEQAGRYSVVVDNGTTVVTNFTYLTVDPTFTKITEGSPVTDLGCSWGAAWGDYDDDGYPDLFVARNNLGHAAVYRGQADGTFATVPGLPFSDTLDTWASGAWADFDNDGRQDLLVTRSDNKPAFLYFNDGNGGFNSLPINTVANWGIALADYDRDGLLDLLFSTGVTAWGSAPAILYRNDGQRGFVRMNSAEVGPLVTLATFGAAIWADYDDDGWMDVYCPHWRGTDALFRNDGTGRFVSVRNAVTQAAQSEAGAWGDYDNDGDLDLCAVSWGGPVRAYRNLGSGEFELVDIGVNLSGNYDSAYWIDYDNDGFLDLFVAGQGYNALYRQSGQGAFSRIQLGSLANEVPVNGAWSYSALWFDYDNNGFLDLYVSNGDDPRSITTANFLYRNNGNDNGWLKVKLIGTTSNREGIGAKVRMLPLGRGQPWQRRDITGGDGYNGNQLYAHFGLGSATSVRTLRIEWPSGIVQELQNIPAKQSITVIEPHPQGAFDDTGAFRIAVTCDTHRSYGLEVSTDLVEWTNVANFAAGSGVYTEDAPHTQRRFYRLR